MLIDDGLASGFTLLVGMEALLKAKASQINLTALRGHWNLVQMLAHQVEAVC